MSTEQPSYSTKTLHRPPSKSAFFQVDVQNDWDLLAEAIVASCPQPSPQLEHFVLLLESHGIVVHRVPTRQPTTPSAIRSHFLTEPSDNNGAQSAGAKDSSTVVPPSNAVTTPSPSLFPRNLALVYGSRVIEAPPSRASSQGTQISDDGEQPAHANELFKLLESAGAEVLRWPVESGSSGGKSKTPESKLVDVGETPAGADKEDEGPRFSPSDILILSPTLLVTRLSSCTNNKGLEYLWSVLSQPASNQKRGRDDIPLLSRGYQPPVSTPRPDRPTTTLLVSITEPESPTMTCPTTPASATLSPRTPTFAAAQAALPKPAPTTYVPLCRALVPIDGRVMLYDPALVAAGEARRLKSVLDRVQEGAGGDVGGILGARHSKRESVMSYGTFGSLDRSDDEGWQFISVDGLHLTSILLVSPELALLSAAPSSSPPASPVRTSSTPTTPSAPTPPTLSNRDAISKVSQVLESLGVRTVSLPFTDLNELGAGVRDAILLLRRESDLAASEDGRVQGEQDAWDRSGEEEQEGCLEPIFAALGTWLCGLLTSDNASETNNASE